MTAKIKEAVHIAEKEAHTELMVAHAGLMRSQTRLTIAQAVLMEKEQE